MKPRTTDGQRSMQHAARPMQRLLPLAVLLLAAGCTTVGPDYQRPAVELPPAFAGAAAAGAREGPAVAADWWTMFGDAELSQRVERALAANTDILQAAARVEQAQTQLREADSALQPGVDLNASAQRANNQTGVPGAAGNSLRAALSTSFEIDFWGRLRRATDAARAQLLASGAARDTVRLGVASLVVQNWIAARAIDEQIAASEATLKTREETLRVLRVRLDAGTGTRLDVEQADALRADAALQRRELQRQRALAESQLALLSAEPGARIPPGRLGAVPALPPAGLPSDLLMRRPDVVQAEQLLVSANAQVGVAQAALLPSFSLTGTLGQQSPRLADLLLAGSRIWSLGFGLNLPLFDGGRLAARADAAGARQREAVAAYQGAAANAFREVADALANVSAARESQADVERRAAATARALELARARYQAGYSPYLELLDAERSEIAARLETVRNRQAQLVGTLALIKALGGGWTASR